MESGETPTKESGVTDDNRGVGVYGDPPRFLSAIEAQSWQRYIEMGNVARKYYREKLEESVFKESALDEPIFTCETDKPEGTRDVDKFLKEQQDRLWRGE